MAHYLLPLCGRLAERSLTLRQLHSAWDYECFNPRWIRCSFPPESFQSFKLETSGLKSRNKWTIRLRGHIGFESFFIVGMGKIAKQNWRWGLAKHSIGRPGECKRKEAKVKKKLSNLNSVSLNAKVMESFTRRKLMLLNQTQVHPPMSVRPIYWHPIVWRKVQYLL